MFHISNFTSNDDIQVLSKLGPFTVIEYQRFKCYTFGCTDRLFL